MFNYGMKVAIYSEKRAELDKVGWHRGGTDISYYKNNIRKDYVLMRYFYTLTFTHTFEYDDDVVFCCFLALISWILLNAENISLKCNKEIKINTYLVNKLHLSIISYRFLPFLTVSFKSKNGIQR